MLLNIASFYSLLKLLWKDEETTNLQIDPSGYLPSPSIVGCTDIAKLAVAFATKKQSNEKNKLNIDDDDRNYTVAIRWCSETLYPQKQGLKSDGYANATTCVHNLQRGIIAPKKLIPAIGSTVHYGIWVTSVIYFWLFVLLRLGFFMFWKNVCNFSGNCIRFLF